MKLKNCVVGAEVQIKNIDVLPTECSLRTSREYGAIEENFGVIHAEPDEDGDVKVYLGEQFVNLHSPNQKHLYVHHTKLRHYCKD